MRYTVTYTSAALNSLARQWIAAPDRRSVARAGDELDRILGEDTSFKGCNAGRGLRQLIIPPLIAEFSVNDDDRIVTIWSVRHIDDLSNGR